MFIFKVFVKTIKLVDMTKEKCLKCKKLKTDVALRACDDRLCGACYDDNEMKLSKLRGGVASATLPQAASSTLSRSQRSSRSAKSDKTKTIDTSTVTSANQTICDKSTSDHCAIYGDNNNKVSKISVDNDDDLSDELCPSCFHTVEDGSEYIRCDTCKKYIHQHCTGMTADVFNVLKPIATNSCWVCEKCRNNLLTFQVAITKLSEELADTRVSILMLKRDMDKLKKADTGTTTQNTSGTTMATVKPLNANTGNTGNTARISVTAEVHSVVRDIARRKRNVIVSGLPEPNSTCDEINAKLDETAFYDLCEQYLPVKPALAQSGCKRLGKRSGNKPRRLLVHLTSEESATSLITSAKLLRNCDDQQVATAVYINRDMSPLEAKEAYEQRQQRRASKASLASSQSVLVPQAALVSTEACVSGAAHPSGDTQVPGVPSDQLSTLIDDPTILVSPVAPPASTPSPLPPNTASPF